MSGAVAGGCGAGSDRLESKEQGARSREQGPSNAAEQAGSEQGARLKRGRGGGACVYVFVCCVIACFVCCMCVCVLCVVYV